MQRMPELRKPYKGNEPYIFISYSHKNSKEVCQIIARFQEAGYRIWYDSGIDPGTEWAENIATKVEKCSYFIAFISKEYIASSNCQDELSYARDQERQRLLVYLEETALPSGMSMRVNRIQAIHKYTYSTESDFFEKLFSTPGIDNCRDHVSAAEVQEKSTPPAEGQAPAACVPAEEPQASAAGTETQKKARRSFKELLTVKNILLALADLLLMLLLFLTDPLMGAVHLVYTLLCVLSGLGFLSAIIVGALMLLIIIFPPVGIAGTAAYAIFLLVRWLKKRKQKKETK